MDADPPLVRGDATLPRAVVAVPTVAGLDRPRLRAALDPVRTRRIGLLVGAPGTGKTTLAAQWAATLDIPAAWCRLQAGAAVPGRLVQWLWQAVAPWLDGPVDEPPADVSELVLRLETRRDALLLVVDDLHTIAGTTAEADLEQVLVLAPPALRVLVASRQMPPFNLARSELPPPVVVTGDDLRFRTWEVERLFRHIHHAPIAPGDVAALARYTQGWAAALQLFHLSTLGAHPAERRRAIHALAGRSRYAQDYLSAQVLAGLPRETRDFLRRTCVFDILTADRCDALLGTDDAQRTLHELERRQALTTSADGGESFSYHEVLRRHLETALREELGPARSRAWYQRAALVLEEEGAVAEALRARCRAEDWEGVQRLLGEFGGRILGVGGAGGDNRWAAMLPAWLTESDPWCRLAEARRLLADGQLDAADAASRQAEAQFTDPAARALCQDVRRSVATWRGGPPPPRPRWGDLLRAATRHDPLAAARAAHESPDPRAVMTEGLALVLAGDQLNGRRVLARAAAESPEVPQAALAAELVLVTLSGLARGPEHGSGPFDRVQVEADHLGMTWLARLAHGLALAIGGHRARAEVAAVVADLERRGDRWAAALVEATGVLAALRSGRAEPDALEALVCRSRELDAGVLEAWARAIGALEGAILGLPDAEATARAAEAAARGAGVPGASAFAYAALAATSPRNRTELLTLARSTAGAIGLGCRPWAWVPSTTVWSQEDTGPPSPTAPTPGAPTMELTCFGGFHLVVDARVVTLAAVRPRARAALKFLAVHAGRPVHREILADALWGDLHPDAAMHNLQVSLSSLRQALEPGVPGRHSRLIVRDGEAYTLTLPPGARCDVVDFEQALADTARADRAGDAPAAAAALHRAVAAYRGDLFPEEGPAEWVVGFRERFRSRAAEAAATLAERELARGDTAAAVAAAQRSTEIDEYRDDAWRVLIAALRRAGEPAAAQRAIRSYGRVLSALGIADPGLTPARGTPPRPVRREPRASPRTPRGS
ncbi:BTAD domain-containing putative transcriptional regulator [Georgenia faecalis]|uniref:BTAD domain-containing putative transcriptional regulator n=1 Tax=Georgenia faecalis TaxID=2483799 RepID=A0ABV9DAX8_9MICO|nr:BTAD domain-containing putative transcriptional regulator [Georgenia faecalis]